MSGIRSLSKTTKEPLSPFLNYSDINSEILKLERIQGIQLYKSHYLLLPVDFSVGFDDNNCKTLEVDSILRCISGSGFLGSI